MIQRTKESWTRELEALHKCTDQPVTLNRESWTSETVNDKLHNIELQRTIEPENDQTTAIASSRIPEKFN